MNSLSVIMPSVHKGIRLLPVTPSAYLSVCHSIRVAQIYAKDGYYCNSRVAVLYGTTQLLLRWPRNVQGCDGAGQNVQNPSDVDADLSPDHN